MAMIAMTTRSSIRVKPGRRRAGRDRNMFPPISRSPDGRPVLDRDLSRSDRRWFLPVRVAVSVQTVQLASCLDHVGDLRLDLALRRWTERVGGGAIQENVQRRSDRPAQGLGVVATFEDKADPAVAQLVRQIPQPADKL